MEYTVLVLYLVSSQVFKSTISDPFSHATGAINMRSWSAARVEPAVSNEVSTGNEFN
jgi:hypothetical protein